MKTRQLIMIVLSCAVLLGIAYVCRRYFYSPDYSIPSRGGTYMVVTNNCFKPPYYLQTDPQWKDERVGGSDEPLLNVGCTVCCVSMAFCHMGKPSNPKSLNTELKKHNGYTKRGLVKWNVAAAASDNMMVFDTPEKPTHDLVDSAVQSRCPVLARILLYGSAPHWVLIVGKNGNDYLVKNPLCPQRSVQRLSELSKRIESIRIVRKAWDK